MAVTDQWESAHVCVWSSTACITKVARADRARTRAGPDLHRPVGQGLERGRPDARGGRDGAAAAAARRGGRCAGRSQRRAVLPALRRRARGAPRGIGVRRRGHACLVLARGPSCASQRRGARMAKPPGARVADKRCAAGHAAGDQQYGSHAESGGSSCFAAWRQPGPRACAPPALSARRACAGGRCAAWRRRRASRACWPPSPRWPPRTPRRAAPATGGARRPQRQALRDPGLHALSCRSCSGAAAAWGACCTRGPPLAH